MLAEKGGNPDAAPLLIFTFDLVSGMASSFLFLSCADVSSVFSLISIDMLENLFMALKVVVLVQKSRHDRLKREGRAKDRRIAELEVNQRRLKLQQLNLERRKSRQFSGCTSA